MTDDVKTDAGTGDRLKNPNTAKKIPRFLLGFFKYTIRTVLVLNLIVTILYLLFLKSSMVIPEVSDYFSYRIDDHVSIEFDVSTSANFFNPKTLYLNPRLYRDNTEIPWDYSYRCYEKSPWLTQLDFHDDYYIVTNLFEGSIILINKNSQETEVYKFFRPTRMRSDVFFMVKKSLKEILNQSGSLDTHTEIINLFCKFDKREALILITEYQEKLPFYLKNRLDLAEWRVFMDWLEETYNILVTE